MSGRGAWPVGGAGGTLNVDGDGPGPYYCLAHWPMEPVGSSATEVNSRAVHGAVAAYQRALSRRTRINVTVDGIYGEQTKEAVTLFQRNAGILVWGGIGDTTSKTLLYPSLERTIVDRQSSTGEDRVTPVVACGLVTAESNWDAGAVGYADPTDIGLVQINGPSNPGYSEAERLMPLISFRFLFDRLKDLLRISYVRDIEDAIVGYNMGSGGVKTWIDRGRPDIADWYTPPRDVRRYITTITTACG